MAVAQQSKRDVESVLQRLNEDYSEFRVVEKTWERTDSDYERVRRQFERNGLGGAGVWLVNDAGEVLLVRDEGDDGWSDPGGKREPGESYESAAKRELEEETGVTCQLTGLCEVHRIENVNVQRDAPSIFEPLVIFDGVYESGELDARDGEIAEVGWFVQPPEHVLYPEVAKRSYPATS
ncbi:ADP-ribose pyrophosphatase YjhB, NUDIX family [Halovenus aranensis]|uniref:ADP-ribose pyrophosphatase YjhB, NUDIX family n=1 Tax=Halovenus aranensis TaxID=890420 RepID=A0A1G8Y3B0_9EURY|nr:NUDIX hydrolase [Halovenus aranensis]SDJ96605.1 ADP-ribose pyrophosphatase YjhB, NUDIX family [Halovenus aranensis]